MAFFSKDVTFGTMYEGVPTRWNGDFSRREHWAGDIMVARQLCLPSGTVRVAAYIAAEGFEPNLLRQKLGVGERTLKRHVKALADALDADPSKIAEEAIRQHLVYRQTL